MGKFCGKCGSQLDEVTKLCPVCDVDEKTVSLFNDSCGVNPVQSQSVPQENASYFQQPVADLPVYSNEFSAPEAQHSNREATNDKPKKIKKKSSKSKGLTLFVTILLSITLFLTSTIALLLFDVRHALDDDNADELLNNVDVYTMLETVNPDSVVYIEDFFDYLYKEYKIDMDKKGLTEIFEQEEVKEYVGSLISDFSDDIFDDSIAKIKITKSDIADLVLELRDYIDDEYGIRPNSLMARGIAEWILPDGDVVAFNSSDLNTTSVNLIRYGLSYASIAFFALLSAGLIFLLIRNNLSQAALGIGIDFMITGGLTGILAILALIPSVGKSAFALCIIGNIFLINAITTVGLFALGVIIILTRYIVKRFLSKRKSN